MPNEARVWQVDEQEIDGEGGEAQQEDDGAQSATSDRVHSWGSSMGQFHSRYRKACRRSVQWRRSRERTQTQCLCVCRRQRSVRVA
jgi:hypothetical protein